MKKSYFDEAALSEKIQNLREENRCAPWLPEALEDLGKSKDVFPREEETDRYTIEYIYPH
jgi:hypothetical protein